MTIEATSALLRLMTWLSPSFPVGAYTYSHGIEYAVEDGLIKTGSDLTDWVETAIVSGAGRMDADIFRDIWRAVEEQDDDRFAEAAELSDAMKATSEMALEATAQGEAFLVTVQNVWPNETLTRLIACLKDKGIRVTYSVAVAMASAAAGVDLTSAMKAYLHGFAANLVSAGVRLVPLGQTDGQRAMAVLEPVIENAVRASLDRSPDDFGTAVPMIDWTSMQHETQYTRLFRS